MTELLLSAPSRHCQADRGCDRTPCFQARLEADPVHQHAELCAEHLGTVQAMAAWAREQGLEGKVTVLAIEQAVPGHTPGPARPGAWAQCGFAFGTILLSS
jgi:hypothetical protein